MKYTSIIFAGLSALFFIPLIAVVGQRSPLLQQKTPPKQSAPPRKSVSFYGILRNGTGAAMRMRAWPAVELLYLNQGMQKIETVQTQQGRFRFTAVTAPQAPYLIRTQYAGASYTRLIPPQKKYWDKPQVLYIYESGAALTDLQIASALNIKKYRDSLHIEKVFSIENQSQPPRSFALKDIHFFVPPPAKNIQNSIRYQSSRMPLPLTAAATAQGVSIPHGLRPGGAALTISYTLKGAELLDRLWQPQTTTAQTRIMLWQPADIRPKLKGGSYTTVTVPQIGAAWQVKYTPQSNLRYDFSNGSFLVRDPLNSDENALFRQPVQTLLALFLLVSYMFGFTALTRRHKKDVVV